MNRIIKKGKGSSLAEMCVVVAVIAIMALAVVSFTALASNRTMISATRLKAMEDLELTQTIMERWIEQMEPYGIQTDGESLTATVDEVDCSLYLENKVLYADFSDGMLTEIQLEAVDELQFEIEKASDTLYFCTIVYQFPNGKKSSVEATYTFCVNLQVGETIPTSGDDL